MKLTIINSTDLVVTLDVSEDMELENFKVLCALEANIDQNDLLISFKGNRLLDNKKTLASFGIKDGDMLLIESSKSSSSSATPAGNRPSGFQNIDFSSIALPNQRTLEQNNRREAENIYEHLRANSEQLSVLRVNNPRLADAFDKGLDEFIKTLAQQQEARSADEQRRIRMLLADPFDSEAQRMIAEEIRRQQVDSNMETAMEYLPESFAEVTMLYINCKVNGFPIKAFVDSGAQSTIMSKACAERCNLNRLIDNRWAGIARGVGTQKLLGKIHLVQLEINGVFVPCSFMVLEHQPMDMLLGLDMLRRYQCSIDLGSNVLRIGTTGTETTFLSESEIPKFSKEVYQEESDVQKAIQNSLNQISNSGQSTAQTSSSRHSEAVVQELMSLGFARKQVIDELDTFNGDKNQAIASLFAKSIVVPDESLKR